ncbi:hypothetical protein NMY22_g17557 [Coprinellus aureogranulatus]|nr:hypothetical protein NMY22_g17557 [Coprinellus aureogranulatus]
MAAPAPNFDNLKAQVQAFATVIDKGRELPEAEYVAKLKTGLNDLLTALTASGASKQMARPQLLDFLGPIVGKAYQHLGGNYTSIQNGTYALQRGWLDDLVADKHLAPLPLAPQGGTDVEMEDVIEKPKKGKGGAKGGRKEEKGKGKGSGKAGEPPAGSKKKAEAGKKNKGPKSKAIIESSDEEEAESESSPEARHEEDKQWLTTTRAM